jgi:DNA-binding winged helix-turn-helix (wHTH) protein/tetratricopeptide (TPR) repeat protein
LQSEGGKEAVQASTMEADRRLTFEGFALDVVNEQLLHGDEIVALTPKAFAVLRCLVEHGGQLVRKEALLRAGWADTHVTDAVLKVSILEIRRALGDDATAPRFIETVPRRGYRLIAHRTTPRRPAAGVAPNGLVGRDSVLATLDERLERARAGRRQLVFLSGEAGIGKTSVIDAVVARAAGDREVMIAPGACLEHFGPTEAYLPFIDAFGRLLRGPGGPHVLGVLERHAPTWLVQFPWLERSGDPAAVRSDLLGVTKERMLREMAEAIEALSASALLVLVLEDLHWSDYSTLDLLGMLARRNEAARLLVFGSYRPVDAIVTRHPLRALVAELRVRHRCEDIALELLHEADVAAYLTGRFHDPTLPPELASAVYRRTDGNPLFMARLADELVTLGVLADDGDRWRLARPLHEVARTIPESLRQLVDKQIARLEPEFQRLLEVASVLTTEFTVPTVAAGLEADPLAVEERCHALAEQGQFLAASPLFVRPDGTAVPRYRFTHSLYPEVLARRLAPARRLRLHQRLGEWLEQISGADTGPVATQIVRHFEEARDYRRAIGHLRAAAERDVRRWACEEAVARLTRALELAARLSSPDADALQPQLLDQLGRVRRALGDASGALHAFDALATWARARGDTGRECWATLCRATVLWWNRPEGSRAATNEAIALSERIADPLLRAHARCHAAHWRVQLHGCRIEDVRMTEEAVAAAVAAGDRELLAQGTAQLGLFLCARAEFRAAARTAHEGVEIARETGNPYVYLWAHFAEVAALQHLGDWGTALTKIDEGLRVAVQIGHGHLSSILRSQVASLRVQACDFAGAAAIARKELRRQPLTAGARRHAMLELGVALLGLGALDEALDAFRAPQVVRTADVSALPWVERVLLRHGLARVWLARGELAKARDEAEALHGLAATADEPVARAVAAQALAEIALLEGRLDQADTAVDEALGAIAGCEAPVVEWRLAVTAARVHDRRRRRADAEASRRRSAGLVMQLADSLPRDHDLRRAFLADASVRAVLAAGR